MDRLESLRQEILALDENLLALLERRNALAQQIGEWKHRQGLPLQNFEAEKQVLEHALERARALGLPEALVRGVVHLLIEAALRVQERDPARRPPKTGRSALVVGGAGLMGRWFCRFLEEQGYDVYVDDPRLSPHPRATARDRTFDLVLVATPPSTLAALLEELGSTLQDSTLLVDIASVKGPSAAVLEKLARQGKTVASLHPLFGPTTDLLMGKNVLVLDAGNARAAQTAAQLFAATAARTRALPLKTHDPLMADVLTLSHAVSLSFNHALAQSGRAYADLEPVASTTFRKQTEVSREVALENPHLYFEIQAHNPASAPALERLETSVRRLRSVVTARDEAGFVDFMRAGRGFYEGGRT